MIPDRLAAAPLAPAPLVPPPGLQALARSRAYALLGDLFGRGLRAETLVAWRQVDGGILGDDPAPADVCVDLEAAAEAHTRFFVLELPAFEGAFLAPDGLLGGAITQSVRAARTLAGLGDPVDVEPDHLAAELAWLGFLCGAEADALRDGVDAGPIIGLQRAALNTHLLRWVPAFVAALDSIIGGEPAGAADRVYQRGANIALQVLIEHAAVVGAGGDGPEAGSAWALPVATDVLEDPRAGLRAIAEHLVLPCQAGGYLTRGVILRAARRLELPTTFGTRADLLEGLLCAAAQYSMVADVCRELGIVVAGWARTLESAPTIAATPWLDRGRRTQALLARVAAAGRADDSDRLG